jgi:ligand-binding sensor domain-containing protein
VADGILALAVDPQGTVWLGTYRSGLVGVDAEGRRRYTRENSPLPHNLVASLAVDPQGRVWAGTVEGLARLAGTSWRIFTVENSGLPADQIRALAVDGKGALWIGTGAGVTRYDEDDRG